MKRYCLVPPTWTLADLDLHPCDDRSHVHLSRAQIASYERDGAIEWLRNPTVKREKGVVRLCCGRIAARGLSARIGAELAAAVRRNLKWARVMLAEINTLPANRIAE